MYPKVDNFYFLSLKRDWLFCPRSTLDELPEDQRQTYCLLKRIRFILNQVTPDSYETYVEHFKALHIETRGDLQRAAKLMYDKAVDEQGFSDIYARMCAELCDVVIPEDGSGNILDFVSLRDYVIYYCQMEMEHRTDSLLVSRVDEKETTGDRPVQHGLLECVHRLIAGGPAEEIHEIAKVARKVFKHAFDGDNDIFKNTCPIDVQVSEESVRDTKDDVTSVTDEATDTGDHVEDTNDEVEGSNHEAMDVNHDVLMESESGFSAASTQVPTPWEEEDEKTVARGRALGNAKFVGELFNVGILSFDIIHRCVRHLLRGEDEIDFECACKLLETIGLMYRKRLRAEGKDCNQYIVQYLHRMGMIEHALEPDHWPKRMHYKYDDLIDLWRLKWKPRLAYLDVDDFVDDLSETEEEVIPIRKVKTPRLMLHV